jgi:hypothetical protein
MVAMETPSCVPPARLRSPFLKEVWLHYRYCENIYLSKSGFKKMCVWKKKITDNDLLLKECSVG